jgi:hypothetical protein
VDGNLPRQKQRIEVLVQALEACPDAAARENARELVRAVMELHAAGLERVLDLASQAGEPGVDLVTRLGQDGLVSSLLLLHGLHPVPLADRVGVALDRVRPRLHAWRGDVELLEATGEVVRLRLLGDDLLNGPALRAAVEEAIVEAAPEVQILSVEECWERSPSSRVPLPLVAGKEV